ncbi:MAG: hypothetical protein HYZ75_08330 [Elusimicrobia bacterium]|nr:hypothetical protein [Elusimicrobiota bacterium]
MIFALGLSTAVLLAGYAQFSTSSFQILRRDFSREAYVNEANSCLVYGDLLARTKAIDNDAATKAVPGAVELDMACRISENGRCIERHRCAITMVGAQINATLR